MIIEFAIDESYVPQPIFLKWKGYVSLGLGETDYEGYDYWRITQTIIQEKYFRHDSMMYMIPK